VSPFTEKDWNEVLSSLAEVIGTDAFHYDRDPVARLTAAIPYLAGSEDPDRFAVSNLLTLYASTKAHRLFDHRATDDDVFRQLATFHVGSRSEPRVVDYGLTRLALISLAAHETNVEADQKAGKPNPIGTGKWDPAALRHELEGDLARSPGLLEVFNAVIELKPA